MSIALNGRGRLLGAGMMYPAGSIRDWELAALLAFYKRDVAGAYTSVSPNDIAAIVPTGRHVASTKIDGEQWFLCRDCECSFLASPNGKVITGVPITEKADQVLTGWTGVLAGELYATVGLGRPRVFDLHSALGGGTSAQVDRLRFAAFDILRDGDRDRRSLPFSDRATRIGELLTGAELIHSVDFAEVDGPDELEEFFESKV